MVTPRFLDFVGCSGSKEGEREVKGVKTVGGGSLTLVALPEILCAHPPRIVFVGAGPKFGRCSAQMLHAVPVGLAR